MWELDHKESWALKKWSFWIVVLDKTLESPLDCKEIQPVHPKGNQSWTFLEGLMLKLKLQYFGHLMEEPTHWKRPWCLERWRAEGEGGDRGWDGCMAPLIQWTWVWTNSWSREGRTGKPGVQQSMRSQRVRHNWATEQQLDLRKLKKRKSESPSSHWNKGSGRSTYHCTHPSSLWVKVEAEFDPVMWQMGLIPQITPQF